MICTKIVLVSAILIVCAFNTFAQKDKDCPEPHYGEVGTIYGMDNKKERKYDYISLDVFAEALKECPNFVGIIHYTTGKGWKPKSKLEYLKGIKNYLVRQKSVSPERLIFEHSVYGNSEKNSETIINLLVMTKETAERLITSMGKI